MRSLAHWKSWKQIFALSLYDMKRMMYLVREVAVIVQIEEGIKIKEEFIPLELRELPIIVAGLGEDLHIAHVVTSVSTVTHCSLQSPLHSCGPRITGVPALRLC